MKNTKRPTKGQQKNRQMKVKPRKWQPKKVPNKRQTYIYVCVHQFTCTHETSLTK